MTISLSVNGSTFTFAEGEVGSVRSETTQPIEQQNFYGYGASKKKLIIMESASKKITIEGVLFVTETSRLDTGTIKTKLEQKKWLESLFNGSSDVLTFTSDYETYTPTEKDTSGTYMSTFSSTQGIIESLNFNEIMGEVNILEFTLVIIVGESYITA